MNLKRNFIRADGEVVPDEREHRMSFASAVDRTVVYLMAALIGWLCISSMDHGKLLTRLVERDDSRGKAIESIQQEQKDLRRSDSIIVDKLQQLEVESARHGWKKDG